MRSAEEHLEPEGDEGRQAPVLAAGEENIAEPAIEEDINVEPAIEDSEGEEEQLRGEAIVCAMGESVDVSGKSWKRVAEVSAPPRTNVREFMLRNLTVSDDTTELELFHLLLPVTAEELLECVKFRAAEASDKYGRFWFKEHIMAYFVCLFGAAQFKPGTDLWAKTTNGTMPAPNFGQYLSHDRYQRIARYLARGPQGVENLLPNDPWAQFRWLVDGFNNVRQRELQCSGRLNPDESMFAWKGKSGVGGIPHLSFIKRKPKPLGLENKCVCDGETGVMLFMEIQEGALRMARKKYQSAHQATTACTLRLVEGCVGTPPCDDMQVTAYIDSWFCSYATAKALHDIFRVDVIGCVKTAHAKFPIGPARWILSTMERGQHLVFHLDEPDEQMWAVGWQDIHYKTYLATCGTSLAGLPAKKKRQLPNGRNYSIHVPRPSCIAEYQVNMGKVDLHNRYRQGMLKLDEVVKTVTWQTRLQNELFATCIVDAFLLSKYYLPKWRDAVDNDNSMLFAWMGELLQQMKAQAFENDYVLNAAATERTADRNPVVCRQIPIGRIKVKDGVQKGRYRAIQHRCRYCSSAKRFEERGNPRQKQGAVRTIYTCVCHPDQFMCKIGKFTCWQEHLADQQPLAQ
jgi:hypothetical protein